MTYAMQDRLAVPVPKLLRARPRDARGYAVPFVVLIDKSGQPQFTINDTRRVADCRSKKLCGLCGKRLVGMWFIGGSRCFMHEHGAFVDPPSHYDCAEYALRVCPFLAAPSYAKRIDDRKLKPENRPEDMRVERVAFMPPSQPERFGLGLAEPGSVQIVQSDHQGVIYKVARWQYVEWWRDGATVNAPDGLPLDQPILKNWRG